jgi:hypothetical protein
MDDQHLAKEAARLLGDDVLISAFRQVRQNALEALAATKPDDAIEIMRQQSIAAVIPEILSLLRSAIIAVPQDQDGPSPFA